MSTAAPALSLAETQYGRFYYYPNDCIGRWLKAGNFWEAMHKPLMDTLNSGDVFVDVGANIGFYPVYLGRRSIRVHAFEASPEIMAVMKMNLQANSLNGELVTLYQTALYDRETELGLEYQGQQFPIMTDGKIDWNRAVNTGTFCLVPTEHGLPGAKAYDFRTKTLDSFGIENVKMLKVDVQGCDLRVLYGGRETIRQSRPIIFFEYEAGLSLYHGDTWDKYQNFFGEMDYQPPVSMDSQRGVEWMTCPNK